MKKMMTGFLAAAFVVAAAGQASATALETKGEYRARYWYLSNYRGESETVESGMDFWDQRLRLNLGWQVAEGVKVGARCDILENVWQTVPADGQEIDFDQAFANFSIGPAAIGVGKMDVSWGPGAYAKADNRYRFKIGGKFDPVAVSFAWDSNQETFDSKTAGDDIAFSLGVTTTAAGWNFGVLPFYRSDKATVPGTTKSLMGIDLTATGAAGPANVVAEFAYATGKNDGPGDADQDRTGMLAYVGAFMPAGPVNAGLEFGYAAGDDQSTKDDEGALFMDYQGPFSSFILFNNFDLDGWNSVYSKDMGLNNALAIKASATMAASKELSFMLAGVYAMASETAEGQDDSMGFEIDALAKYAVSENVTAQAGIGYLAAGDYFGKDVDSPMVGTVQFVVTF